ncbi:MAG: ribonuclease Z, partial [Cyclobacteriaceae bacterium]
VKRYSIPAHKVDRIFISHLHGDHYLGLMGLLFSMHLQRRTSDLHIYSQSGLDEIILLQLKHSKSTLNYKLVFHPIVDDQPHCLFEDDVLSVHTIPLQHKISCTGFLFREKDRLRNIDKKKLTECFLLEHIAQLKRGMNIYHPDGTLMYKNEDYTLPPRPPLSYAYCSDTRYDENLVEQIMNVDLLYHEATFMNEHRDKAEATLHSTASEAATIAKKAKVNQLLLGHYSARYRELDSLLAEATGIFEKTRLAIEGETIDLEKL